jgi:hypothetical protein
VQAWGTFAAVCGAAAASLTGLLFVAVSIRIDVIAQSGELRNRAAQTLSLFLIALFVAIVLAIPGQAYGPLGAELIALALIAGVALLVLDRRARSGTRAPGATNIGHLLDVIAPNAVTSILLLVAGVLVALGVHAGLYVLVLPVISALAGGVTSAWLLLTKISAHRED